MTSPSFSTIAHCSPNHLGGSDKKILAHLIAPQFCISSSLSPLISLLPCTLRGRFPSFVLVTTCFHFTLLRFPQAQSSPQLASSTPRELRPVTRSRRSNALSTLRFTSPRLWVLVCHASYQPAIIRGVTQYSLRLHHYACTTNFNMAAMARHGRLTHERLVVSLERLHGAVEAQFPELKDIQRAQDIQRVIKDALTAARAGMSGASVASPVQLKREVEARIVGVHERHNELEERDDSSNSSAVELFSTSGRHTSLPTSQQKTPAPRRTRHTLERGKENTTPTAPSQQPFLPKLSAIKKTTITKRATSSKPSTTAGNKKRHSRNTRNKPTTQPPAATPLPISDEADRRAAAAALLDLAEHSPETSFASAASLSSDATSSSGATPSTGGKRARDVYENNGTSNHTNHFPECASSSPAQKRYILAPGTYAPTPRLDAGMSVQQGFMMGVEYAVQQLSGHEGFQREEVAEDLRRWVGSELGLQGCTQLEGSLNVGRNGANGSIVMVRDADCGAVNVASGGGAGKRFWDVV